MTARSATLNEPAILATRLGQAIALLDRFPISIHLAPSFTSF